MGTGGPSESILLHSETIGFLQVRADRAPVCQGTQQCYVDHAVQGRPSHLKEASCGVLTIEVEGQSKTIPHEDEIREATTGAKESVAISVEGILGAPFSEVAIQSSIERDQRRRLAS